RVDRRRGTPLQPPPSSACGSPASAGSRSAWPLNGASSGGIFVSPPLVIAIAATGFEAAMVGAATVVAVILIPAIAIGIDRPPIRTEATGAFLPHGGSRSEAGSASAPPRWTRAEALRSLAFWNVAGPFALALMAQVGFL